VSAAASVTALDAMHEDDEDEGGGEAEGSGSAGPA
jgi:hypothetical protein